MQKLEKGFTLIELIIVITIIGILSAVALPKFVNLGKEARVAKLKMTAGSAAAASNIIHGAVLAKDGAADAAACPGTATIANNSQAATGTVCSEAGIVGAVYSYPATVVTASLGTGNPGIIGAMGMTNAFNPTAAQLTAVGWTVTGVGNVQTFQLAGAPTPANCSFTYTQPTAAGQSGAVSEPVTTGC